MISLPTKNKKEENETGNRTSQRTPLTNDKMKEGFGR
jgi:hypothetical protein